MQTPSDTAERSERGGQSERRDISYSYCTSETTISTDKKFESSKVVSFETKHFPPPGGYGCRNTGVIHLNGAPEIEVEGLVELPHGGWQCGKTASPDYAEREHTRKEISSTLANFDFDPGATSVGHVSCPPRWLDQVTPTDWVGRTVPIISVELRSVRISD